MSWNYYRGTGPTQSLPPTSYNAVIFISFNQAHYSTVMTFHDIVKIPDNDNYYILDEDNSEFTITTPGYYEITLCGQISGVDQNHGAIFYLTEKTGAVVQDLSFELKAGTTARMDCSETIITKFDNSTTLYVRCGIIGDNDSAKIDFANVNLIIKKYNVT